MEPRRAVLRNIHERGQETRQGFSTPCRGDEERIRPVLRRADHLQLMRMRPPVSGGKPFGKAAGKTGRSICRRWHHLLEVALQFVPSSPQYEQIRNMQDAEPESWLKVTPKGSHCVPGDFFIDPHSGVDRAIVTHGHGDHARPGHRSTLATAEPSPFPPSAWGSAHGSKRKR